MASTEFPTFEAFWTAISQRVKHHNRPTYHPCCQVWVSRHNETCRATHTKKVVWGEALRSLKSSDTDPKTLLLAHMLEHQWGLPIHLDSPCTARVSQATLNQALENTQNQAQPRAHSSPDNKQPEAVNNHTPVSEPALVAEAHTPIRFPSQQPQASQQTQLQPIQIIMNPNRPMPIQPDVLSKIRQINYRSESSLHVGNINSQEIKAMSNFCRSSFQASDQLAQEMAAKLEATSKELNAMAERTNLLDKNVHEMRSLVYHLVSQLSAAQIESAAVQAVKNEMQKLEQKQSGLLQAKVGRVVDPEFG